MNKSLLGLAAIALVVINPMISNAENSSGVASVNDGIKSEPVSQGPSPAQMASKAIKLIFSQVDSLTGDQKDKIVIILNHAATEGQALIDSQTLSKKDRRVQMTTLLDRTREAVRAILTETQRSQFDVLVKTASGRLQRVSLLRSQFE